MNEDEKKIKEILDALIENENSVKLTAKEQSMLDDVVRLLEGFDKNLESLALAKSERTTPAQWMDNQLRKSVERVAETEEDQNKMRNIIECAKTLPAVVGVELDEKVKLDEINEDHYSEWLQPLIDGNLLDQDIINKKKIIAKAIIKGINNGVIARMEAPDIAALIDEGITRISVAKQVAQGTLDTVEAMNVFIDHAMARVVTIADEAITKAEQALKERSDEISDKLVDVAAQGLKVAASAFPPTRVLVPFIDTAAQYIKPAARVVVKKGITLVANAARTVVKKAAPFVIDIIKQAGRRVKNFLKK